MLSDTSIPIAVQGVIALPFLAIAGLGINLFVLWAISQAAARRSLPAEIPFPPADELPRVLIQLPVYNEPTVIRRLLHAVAALDWPRDRMRIQLLDDSTDSTTKAAAVLIANLRSKGFDAAHIRRTDRQGYKAGALAEGLHGDDSPFVAIFDADFIPPRDFLRRAMPALLDDDHLAFAQARWEHLNAAESMLTAAQAMMIDAHFVVEQRARSSSSLMLPFNGTCGVWRRAAIDDAGGWSADTLCEDLDLSIRARLRGWRAIYLTDLSVPGELPATLSAWRAQQFRWTKGFVQVARKLLGQVWRSKLPVATKLGLTMQTCQSVCYPLTALSVLGTLVLLVDSSQGARTLSWFGGIVALFGIGGSALCLITAGAVLKRRYWLRFPVNFAVLLLLNAGLMVSNSRAVWEALTGKRSPFMRTPKRGALGIAGTAEKAGPSGAIELLLGCGLAATLAYEAGWLSPFFSLSIAGLLLVGAGLAREHWLAVLRHATRRRTSDQSAQ